MASSKPKADPAQAELAKQQQAELDRLKKDEARRLSMLFKRRAGRQSLLSGSEQGVASGMKDTLG